MGYAFIEHGHVTTPQGWRVGVAACGIRYRRQDLALLVSDAPCTGAALFTTNKVKASHIHYDQEVLERNTSALRAVLINSGSANACTGQAGIDAAATTAHAVEEALSLPADSTIVMSTGVIGVLLPVEKVLSGIGRASQKLRTEHGPSMAHAIMTTDTRPKQCAVQVTLPSGGEICIGGVAKGSGMIHPNMGTMLSVITTDAAITPAALKAALRYAADHSFHCITVDSDTSTNDTLLALANGLALHPITNLASNASPELTDRLHDYLVARAMNDQDDSKQQQMQAQIQDLGGSVTALDDIATDDVQAFTAALTAVCQYLAREVARDGEGATRLVTIRVTGAASYADAHCAAMSAARSPLVKTALFGADPNWGRIVCALGYSGVDIDPQQLVLRLGGIKVFEHGVPASFDEEAAHGAIAAAEVLVEADLGMGDATATVWTCDLSYNYVKINTEYRT